MSIKADNEDQWKDLPMFVIINPRMGAMFNDTELSGLFLSQLGGVSADGTPIRPWGSVPKANNCSRIKKALDVGLLFPCKPGGDCTKTGEPLIKDKLENIMSKGVVELCGIINTINDIDLLNSMKAYEEAKSKKDRRLVVLMNLKDKLDSTDTMRITQSTNIIKNKDGKYEKDVVGVK